MDLVNGFGEARSEAPRPGLGFLGHQLRGLGERCKGSRILKTQDDLSGQQDYGPQRFYFYKFAGRT